MTERLSMMIWCIVLLRLLFKLKQITYYVVFYFFFVYEKKTKDKQLVNDCLTVLLIFNGITYCLNEQMKILDPIIHLLFLSLHIIMCCSLLFSPL